ncbi:hypothetical protein Q5752_001390 [Cryptotrichosporon argae]
MSASTDFLDLSADKPPPNTVALLVAAVSTMYFREASIISSPPAEQDALSTCFVNFASSYETLRDVYEDRSHATTQADAAAAFRKAARTLETQFRTNIGAGDAAKACELLATDGQLSIAAVQVLYRKLDPGGLLASQCPSRPPRQQ